MKIIIADDDRLMQIILAGLLEENGYEVYTANSGEAVLAELNKNHYDLLVTDIVMEGMNGIELVKTLKTSSKFQNLPVILLSGKNDSDVKVKAFNVMADDYITKPFDTDELVARIHTRLRLRHLQEEIEHKNQLLSQRNAELEANLDTARRFQMNLLPMDITEMDGLYISSFYQPIDKVGGDLFDIIPLGNGKVAVFISDVSGHGVPAAFLNITLKMTLRAILKEEASTPSENCTFKVLEMINKRIMQYIQDSEFITALYSIIDVNNKLLYISSAGHPKALIIRKEGNRASYIESRGLCLGFSSDASYTTNIVKLYPGDRIIFYTDGLPEMKNRNGRYLGSDGLINLIRRHSSETNIGSMTARFVRELEDFSKDKEHDDDLTILCIEITDSCHYNWTTSKMDIDEATRTLITPFEDRSRDDSLLIKKVKVALYEALMNAIDHGNLEISSQCRNINWDEAMYESIKRERLANPEYGNRKVTAGYHVYHDRITWHIRDDGSGFSYMNVDDPASEHSIEKLSGRGLALISMFMDEVSFNDKGNEIRMVKTIR